MKSLSNSDEYSHKNIDAIWFNFKYFINIGLDLFLCETFVNDLLWDIRFEIFSDE